MEQQIYSKAQAFIRSRYYFTRFSEVTDAHIFEIDFDEDGYIGMLEHKNELINVSGYNVYPNEIEEVISSHAKVEKVGAIGVPNPRTTEMVKVYIVKKDPSLTRVELFNYCRERLKAYKVPKLIEFREELPKPNM